MNRESKAKHTQGKWEVGKTARNEFTSIWVGGTRIALVDEVPHEGSEANARLIAEAPTLLSELEVSTSIMESVLHLFGESMAMSTKFGLTRQIESNKELIKKIEG